MADRSPAVSFERIVGQDDLKQALLAVVAEEQLDGLLIRGEKGTGKSTAVRGLVELLPEQSVIVDCPYGCPPDEPGVQCAQCRDRSDPAVETRPVPLVTLPLGATRERIVGSLSVTDALSGEPEFEPGLLARANRGILYVDEVNLLDDHLVDVLLDAAASGDNRVERDGVSVTHPADFTLIGTMNPEEGRLRPQLRDRFALQATVEGCADVADRVTIVDRALGEEETASGHDGACADETTTEPRDRLLATRDRLPAVELPDSLTRTIAELCLAADVEGHRGDIAIARTARTFAALDGRRTVHEPDVEAAARFALPHRLQSRPFDDDPDAETILEEFFDDSEAASADEGGDGEGEIDQREGESGDGAGADEIGTSHDPETAKEPTESDRSDSETEATDESGRQMGAQRDESDSEPSEQPPAERRDQSGTDTRAPSSTDTAEETPAGDQPTVDQHGDGSDADADEQATPLVPGTAREAIGDGVAPAVEVPTDREGTACGSDGHATPSTSATATGARVRTERRDGSGSVDAAATIRAAATRDATSISERDLRQSVRAETATALIVVAIDASASMRGPMRAAKGTVLDLLGDAYEQRDAVAVVAFAGTDAEVLLPPTDSVELAARHLKELPTGDRTPLPAGIDTTAAVLERADPDIGVAVIVTDGRATAGTENPTAETRTSAQRLETLADRTIVVDAGGGRGLTELLAAAADGRVVSIDDLTPERVDSAIGSVRE